MKTMCQWGVSSALAAKPSWVAVTLRWKDSDRVSKLTRVCMSQLVQACLWAQHLWLQLTRCSLCSERIRLKRRRYRSFQSRPIHPLLKFKIITQTRHKIILKMSPKSNTLHQRTRKARSKPTRESHHSWWLSSVSLKRRRKHCIDSNRRSISNLRKLINNSKAQMKRMPAKRRQRSKLDHKRSKSQWVILRTS